jgi:hypothetical protein
MFIFGDVAPASPKWWAPWIYTCVFGSLAAALTYAAAAHMAPLDRDRGFVWSFVGMLWLVVAAAFVKAVVVTLRALRGRGGT